MRSPPSSIRVILHIYYSPEALPDPTSACTQGAIEEFLREGLIQKREQPSEHGSGYEVTERGRHWVEMICTTPLPVQVWLNPLTKEICPQQP